jgi:hypothetical protein
VLLEVDQHLDAIRFREAGHRAFAMLRNASHKIIGDADVERSPGAGWRGCRPSKTQPRPSSPLMSPRASGARPGAYAMFQHNITGSVNLQAAHGSRISRCRGCPG